jgi:hypothetical protein
LQCWNCNMARAHFGFCCNKPRLNTPRRGGRAA